MARDLAQQSATESVRLSGSSMVPGSERQSASLMAHRMEKTMVILRANQSASWMEMR